MKLSSILASDACAAAVILVLDKCNMHAYASGAGWATESFVTYVAGVKIKLSSNKNTLLCLYTPHCGYSCSCKKECGGPSSR